MRQLRGEELKSAIHDGIYALAEKADKEGRDYVYNASELARFIRTSRPTLMAYAEFIDSVLKGLKADKRVRTGRVILQHMMEKIEKLEADKKALEKEVNTLRNNHVEIYTKLLRSSQKLAFLISPYVETVKDGKCVVCNAAVGEEKPPARDNVLVMEKIKEQQKQRKEEMENKYEDF